MFQGGRLIKDIHKIATGMPDGLEAGPIAVGTGDTLVMLLSSPVGAASVMKRLCQAIAFFMCDMSQ
jgi:hypothetical protein